MKKVHLIGICGSGMASLAGMLKARGFEVTGSDEGFFPPAADLINELGIPVKEGYSPDNLPAALDLVVVGNVIRADNPEARAVLERNLPHTSLPGALRELFLGRARPLVVAGTHGKTTTCALLAFALSEMGLAPSFFLGGVPRDFGRGYGLGAGELFVLEGDEYDTAFFDKSPKFMHYLPEVAAITSVELDHLDIYRDIREIEAAFRGLVEIIPEKGGLAVSQDDPRARDLARFCRGRVVTFGLSPEAQVRGSQVVSKSGRTFFSVTVAQKRLGRFRSSLPGRHNVRNMLAAVAMASFLDIDLNKVLAAISRFAGVRRRQELVGEAAGVRVIDDFAHHPTAIGETIEAVRSFYGARVLAAFEPKTNSTRRKSFLAPLADALALADLAVIKHPPDMWKIPEEERIDPVALKHEIEARGAPAAYFEEASEIAPFLAREAQEGDVILVMSNGPFDGLPHKVLELLSKK